ncbi:uncharacterized protein LOC117435091 [Acipenser ruthenus]|uniref:uncharacterized protein LOC117435091 n=1 Tax=Acipenser ruthenus TaxID=7906 RepID=UPI002740430C|nr:uncharacterized protein LOC117435091 [Acipenser ruthenus]
MSRRIDRRTRIVFLCLVLHVNQYLAKDFTLEVDDPIHALVNQNVSLKCLIVEKIPEEWINNNFGVQWKINSKDKMEEVLYTYNAGEITSKREGASISQDAVKIKNASLSLPNIQFKEEGDYTCVVFNTPWKSEKTFKVTVSSYPEVTLTPEDLKILLGNEKSLECKVSGFYPEKIEIAWKKSKDGKVTAVSSDHVCTGTPAINSDQTFSITSSLRLQPSLEDNGNVYQCEVMHRTFKTPLVFESRLSVEESQSSGSLIAGILIPVLLILLVITAVSLYMRFKAVLPKVTELNIPGPIKHKDKATISSVVSGFRPDVIDVILKLKRSSQDCIDIFKWHNQQPITSKRLDNYDEIIPINGTVDQDPHGSFKAIITEMEKHSDGTFSIICTISVTPDIDMDAGAELVLEVQHSAVTIRKSVTITVVGVKPRIHKVIVPPVVIHNELVALTCPINGFKPRPAAITWHKKEVNGKEKEVLRLEPDGKLVVEKNREGKKPKYSHGISEMEYEEDSTHDVISILTFVPTIQDDNEASYICKVYHVATEITQETKETIYVKAAPKLDAIQLSPDVPQSESLLTLSCRVHSYFPQATLEIVWYLEGKRVEEGTQIGDVIKANDGLFYCTSFFKMIPTWRDVGKVFTCEVRHESIAEPRTVEWKLDELVSVPVVTDIKSDPPLPEIGKPMTLSCVVKDYYPKDCTIAWVQGFERTDDGMETDEPEFDEERRVYSRKTQRTFIPTMEDYGSEYTVEIVHQGITQRPPKNVFVMKFKGVPTVGDIIKGTDVVDYGQPVTLSCDVTGFLPKEIQAEWLHNGKKVHNNGIKLSGPDENGFYSLRSIYQLTPTAHDFNKDVLFSVKHQTLKKAVIKEAYISLSAKPPIVSNLIIEPQTPEISRKLRMSLTIEDYSPEEIKVEWYRYKGSFEKKPVTTCTVAENGLFRGKSVLEFIPKATDQGGPIRCEVMHPVTKEMKEKSFVLFLKDCPVLSEINCHPKFPKLGEQATLTCNISKFKPKDIQVVWFNNKTKIQSGVNTSEPKCHDDGYYYLTTELTTTALGKGDKYVLQVSHQLLDEPMRKEYVMGLNKTTEESQIKCLQKNPKAGEELTLECTFKGLKESAEIIWHNNGLLLDAETWVNKPSRDPPGIISTLTLTPAESETKCEIVCEASDCYLPVGDHKLTLYLC